MSEKLRVLFLEDSPSDVEMIERELEKGGLDHILRIASTRDVFIKELEGFRPHIVLADYKLSSFDGMSALKIVKKGYPDVPVILVPGIVGEETAVECLSEGITDYVMKDRLFRLIPVLRRALREVEERGELKKSEEEQKRALCDWQNTFESVGDSMMVLDNSFKVIKANRGTEKFIKRSIDGIIGKHCYELVHGTISPPDFCPARKMMITRSHEEEQVKLAGTDIWAQISVYPVFDEKKEISGAIHVIGDITRWKNAEEALRISETKYKTIFESSKDAIMLVTQEKGFFDGNPATVEMFACKDREEFASKTPAQLSPEYQPDGRLSLEKAQEMMALAMKNGTNFFEWTHKRANGEEFFATVLLTRMELEGRDVLQATVRDITNFKKAEESQRLAQLGQLVSFMAHEVNNPLIVIYASAQISLTKDPISPDVRKRLKLIMEQCERAKEIILRLLKFAKPGKGEEKEVDVNSSVDYMVLLLEHQYLLENVKIARRYGTGLPPLTVDEKQLQEVLVSLLNNAKEAMPKGGVITVSTSMEGDHVRIDIKDTGCGISEGNKKRIFEPFFTTKENGTGLGLAVSYGIIKAHGGKLEYESSPENGTTASILLRAAGNK
jgi:PAS domain S-box-containing protein